MIKLFRKVRQKMLTENKFNKYLLYAIGEIILVVIGILIALQINEWNNERNRNNAEQKIVRQLQTDLVASAKELEKVKMFCLKRAQASAHITRAFYKTEIPNESILEFISLPRSSIIYSPILGTARSLINSGNIDLLSSKELKNEIVSYVEKVDYLLKDINRYEETYYRKGIEKSFDVMPTTFQSADSLNKLIQRRANNKRNKLDLDFQINRFPIKIEKVAFRTDLNELFQNKDFFIAYSNLLIAHRNMYFKYDQILTLTSEMLEKLNRENPLQDELIIKD